MLKKPLKLLTSVFSRTVSLLNSDGIGVSWTSIRNGSPIDGGPANRAGEPRWPEMALSAISMCESDVRSQTNLQRHRTRPEQDGLIFAILLMRQNRDALCYKKNSRSTQQLCSRVESL